MRQILACGILLLVHLFFGSLAYASPSELDWKSQAAHIKEAQSIYEILRRGQGYKQELFNKRLTIETKENAEKEDAQLLDALDIKLMDLQALESLVFGMFDVYGDTLDGSLKDFKAASLKQLSDFLLALQKSHQQIHNIPVKEANDMPSEQTAVEHKYSEHHAHDVSEKGTEVGNEAVKDLVNDMLQDVRLNADHLEEGMHHNMFSEGLNKADGSTLEAVVKILDEEQNPGADSGANNENAEKGRQVTLIDQENNQYIMSRPSDTTVFYEDMHFIHDLVLILVGCFIFGWIFSLFGLPAFFGYILAGNLAGPSGYDLIQELIQTETLAQLGVIFIVFVLGLEFSLDKMRAMWRIALGGALLILFATVIIFVLVSLVIGANTSEAVFVGACVSLSSTAVVVKCVKSDELEHMYGLLVMQDVLLGIMLAMIPALSKSGMEIVFAIAKMTLYIFVFGCISVAIARLLPIAVRLVNRTLGKKAAQHNHELLLLGTIAICFTMMVLSDRLDLGLELGCFTAGVIVRSRKQWFESCLSIIEPIRDVFGCLFFASIGLHVYPSFLLSEAMVLLTLTAAVIGFKYVIISLVLVLFRIDLQKSSMMAIGLAQISEFSFVLASRAKQMNIISREVYYLLLAVSAMTLMTTPILWNLIAGRSSSSGSGGGPLTSLPIASAGGPNGLKWNSHERSSHTRSASTSHYSYARIPRLRDDAHHDMVTLPLHEDAEKAA